MSTAPARQPKGVPTGGQFAAGVRGESPARLADRQVPTPLDDLRSMRDPRSDMSRTDRTRGGPIWTGRILLAHLVTDHQAMTGCAESGRRSETPEAPIELCLRDGVEGRFEVVDGHHRICALLDAHETSAEAVIFDYVDDEPYEGPFFDFEAACA